MQEIQLQFFLPGLLVGGIAIALYSRLLSRYTVSGHDRDRERIGFFDFLKGVSILAIVAIHATAAFPEYRWANNFLWFAVPLFIFSTGYLLARRYSSPAGEYYRSFARRVVLPYAIFCVFVGVASAIATAQFDSATFAADVLLGRLNGGALYFIPLIIQLYLLFPLLQKARQNVPAWIILLGAYAFSIFFKLYDNAAQATAWNADPVSLAFCGRYLFFFAAGMYLSHVELGKKVQKVAGASLVVFLLASALAINTDFFPVYLYFYPLACLIIIAAAYHAAREWANAASRAMEAVGKSSLFIYLVHPAVIFSVAMALGAIPAAFLFVILISVAAGMAAAAFYQKAAGYKAKETR